MVLRRYDVYTSEPGEISLEMVAPKRYQATLREAAYAEDPDTSNPRISTAWMGMSASGDITAPVIYAHSGNPEDFAVLREQGIDVRGKIVLVRYSNPYSYRGFKALTAERAGAAAILIYSDPQEDGYGKGKVFPRGPWGPETHFQRGAIEYDFQQAGDPTTPGWPSVPGAAHAPAATALPVPKIMALPLSWHDAKPLLENMDGPLAPKSWQGGLKFKYHLGGERVRAHLKIRMTESLKANYVVEGRIRGSEFPDEWVLAGNHRDAWVFGASDPSSGTASMLEMTRGLGQLVRAGIRPKRTLVFLSWDGEETSYAGSAEWSEQFAHELHQKAVAYLNVDMAAGGANLDANSSGSLAPLLVEATKAVTDPKGRSVYELWSRSRTQAQREPDSGHGIEDFTLPETRIGSGSDYAALLDHVGVPVVDIGFYEDYGVYHSAYDNFYWMSHFGDPDFSHHVMIAQLWGVLALRLSNADYLPYDFGSYGAHIGGYLEALAHASDVQGVELAPLRTAIADFTTVGQELRRRIGASTAAGPVDPLLADQINRGMMDLERNWLDPAGVPGRPYYRHLLYACRQTYAHLELPGLTEAVEAKAWDTAQQQARLLQSAARKNTLLVKQLSQELACSSGGDHGASACGPSP